MSPLPDCPWYGCKGGIYYAHGCYERPCPICGPGGRDEAVRADERERLRKNGPDCGKASMPVPNEEFPVDVHCPGCGVCHTCGGYREVGVGIGVGVILTKPCPDCGGDE